MLQNKNNTLDFIGQPIYVGIDVHNKMWKVCVSYMGMELQPITSPPKPEALIKYLRKNFPGGSFSCAYEAGYSGFWIEEALRKEGVDCIVVNAADVPSKDKEKRYKTDRIDSRKIARCLRSGELEGIYCPSREELEDRSLLRTRQELVKQLTRVKNQIKSILGFYGILSNEIIPNWSKKYIQFLRTVAMHHRTGGEVLSTYLDNLNYLQCKLLKVTKSIKELSEETKYKENVEILITAPGISNLSAMILLTELCDIKRFSNSNKLNSFVGFIPSEYSSGEKEIKYGISHRGNSILRRIIIESFWVAIKKDPALFKSFAEYCKNMRKNKAIIKIARRLLNRIRYMLLNNRPYISGIEN